MSTFDRYELDDHLIQAVGRYCRWLRKKSAMDEDDIEDLGIELMTEFGLRSEVWSRGPLTVGARAGLYRP